VSGARAHRKARAADGAARGRPRTANHPPPWPSSKPYSNQATCSGMALDMGQCSAGPTAGDREVRPHARGTSVTGCPPPGLLLSHAREQDLDLSVRASIASSYESLPDHPRRAFSLLARLGPADFAEWVVGALLDEPDIADVIDELVGRSLVTPMGTDSTGEPRYRLHDLLREFAAERLDHQPDSGQNDALGRLFDSWLQLAMLAVDRLPPEPTFPRPGGQPRPSIVPGETAQRLTADANAWFSTERANLWAAVKQACHAGRLDFARRLPCLHSLRPAEQIRAPTSTIFEPSSPVAGRRLSPSHRRRLAQKFSAGAPCCGNDGHRRAGTSGDTGDPSEGHGVYDPLDRGVLLVGGQVAQGAAGEQSGDAVHG
jgi:hypothetical protein